MTDDELAELVDANYASTWMLLARHIGGGEVRETDGLVVAITGLPLASFNAAFVRRPLRDPVRQLMEAIGMFDERGVPFQVTIRDRVDPLSERACLELGLAAREEFLPGMALADLTVARRNEIWTSVRIDRVVPENLDQYVSVAARGFGMPREIMAPIATPQLFAVPAIEGYLGYVDDRPVATGLLAIGAAVAGVFNIVTEEAYRRRGIGEQMTWHVIARGREHGCTVAALQASPLGRPIYERMGFRLVSPYLEFRRPTEGG